jgi:parallel beta-helix repeat protein
VQGIFLYNSSGNTFENNTVNNNGNIGIYVLDNSNFNNISGNKVSGNNDAGILMDVMCFSSPPPSSCSENTNNTIYGNEISNNGIGIQSENSNSTINSNYVCGNIILDFNASDWLSSSGNNNTCDNSDDWNDEGINACWYTCSGLPRVCDLNRDGIIFNDWNDLMRAYKCFLGLGKSCAGVDYQDWNGMEREYQCFLNSV